MAAAVMRRAWLASDKKPELPEIPKRRPPTKEASCELLVRMTPVGRILDVLDTLSWLEAEQRASALSSLDPPKPLKS
jgi:hypothetical protein